MAAIVLLEFQIKPESIESKLIQTPLSLKFAGFRI
jgi:hypothetical protein